MRITNDPEKQLRLQLSTYYLQQGPCPFAALPVGTEADATVVNITAAAAAAAAADVARVPLSTRAPDT